tara:strand:+ start:351 stop:494 length:144 start_codon:yes stop_codon:yes gene_type:complete
MSWAASKELCSKHDFEWLGEVCRLAEYTKTAPAHTYKPLDWAGEHSD